MKPLLAYAQLVRLPNTFTALADILLGALATGFLSSRWNWFWGRLFAEDTSRLATVGQELRSWTVLVCLAVASTLLYWSGMVWNDYFDLDQDRLERPNRPLASGRVTLRAAFWFACGLMAVGLLLAGLADVLSGQYVRIRGVPPEQVSDAFEFVIRWRSLPTAAALVMAIFLYDGMLKTTWAGPVAMGLCRFLNILLGLSVVNLLPPFWGWLLAFIIGTYIAGVTWFARTEARASNQSILMGAGIVMLVSLVLALTIPALALETTPDGEPSRFFPYLLAGFGVYLGLAVVRAIKRPDPKRVQPAVKRAILGLIILDALMASAFVGSIGLLLAILLIPGIILGRWLYST
ncbi:MAG: hypothetical protein EXR98_12815 [Gemmataceae bacterium]|nr:hypothetical protein [Gemmataceae bacterium]